MFCLLIDDLICIEQHPARNHKRVIFCEDQLVENNVKWNLVPPFSGIEGFGRC
jgi:hypothetical protein